MPYVARIHLKNVKQWKDNGAMINTMTDTTIIDSLITTMTYNVKSEIDADMLSVMLGPHIARDRYDSMSTKRKTYLIITYFSLISVLLVSLVPLLLPQFILRCGFGVGCFGIIAMYCAVRVRKLGIEMRDIIMDLL